MKELERILHKAKSIEIDSRKTTKDTIFFALKGEKFDGIDFAEDVLAKGAILIICRKNHGKNLAKFGDKILEVENPFELLTKILPKFYQNLPQNIFAITGTNGKSSICHFLAQMLEILAIKTATIGTLGIKVSNQNFGESALTTPDICSLYQNLSLLKKHGINHVAIEASSIGLDQKRMAGIKIASGAFTNLTQDHLDYHGDMENYFAAKMLLFTKMLPENLPAILNYDEKHFAQITKICHKRKQKIISYSIREKRIFSESENIFFKNFLNQIADNFVKFQQENILCALAILHGQNLLTAENIVKISQNFDKISSPNGRMELISTLKNNAKIFIDYAHTPDALENTLKEAKKLPHNKLHILFGCGGNRDKGKRKLMAQIASKLADKIIVTDDNPRNENPEIIREEIMKFSNQEKTQEISGRQKAIEFSMETLDKNDILILAGKGHEKYQIIGNKKVDFDEEKIVNNYILTS